MLSANSKETLVIILGGGKGSRLYPLTKDRCKPAVPLGGKYRLIDVPISNCINSGLKKIYIATQFMSASLNQHISRAYQMDVFSSGFVSILAATQTHEGAQDWFEGTADAVRKGMMVTNIHRYKRVIILSGDQLYKMDYNHLIETHEKSGADITISVLPVKRDLVNGFGVMKINDSGQIVEFVEKPSDENVIDSLKVSETFAKEHGLDGSVDDRNWLASMGIYVFETPALLEILEDESKIDFGKDVIPSSLTSKRTQAHLFDGYWEDIGTIKSFFDANIGLGAKKPLFDFYGGVDERIFTHQRFLTASRFLGSSISESIISDGCIIDENSSVTKSVLGVRSRIGSGAKIEETYIMGSDYYERWHGEEEKPPIGIGKDVIIKRAILDKNVTIGDNSKIVNVNNLENADDKLYHIRDGIIIIPKNTIIPPGTTI